jgi:hypothetical protein
MQSARNEQGETIAQKYANRIMAVYNFNFTGGVTAPQFWTGIVPSRNTCLRTRWIG